MTNFLPVSWQESLGGLRNRVMSAFDHWTPARKDKDSEERGLWWPAGFVEGGMPAVDIEETDSEVIVTAELPGLERKDFEVELQSGRLVLRGEKKTQREEKKSAYYYAESSYGSFYRAVPLPCEVEADKAEASYKHGVLRVQLPKSEEAKARRINVKVH